jgi:hypothetical protein
MCDKKTARYVAKSSCRLNQTPYTENTMNTLTCLKEYNESIYISLVDKLISQPRYNITPIIIATVRKLQLHQV